MSGCELVALESESFRIALPDPNDHIAAARGDKPSWVLYRLTSLSAGIGECRWLSVVSGFSFGRRDEADLAVQAAVVPL